MIITPEQRARLSMPGLSDVVLKAEDYDRIRPLLAKGHDEIPQGIRYSQDAFFRDLPELLKDESLLGQCVAYRGDERIGIAPSDEPLIREINRLGIRDDEFDLFVIRPQDHAPEEVTYPSSWQ